MAKPIILRCSCGNVVMELAPRAGAHQGNRLICHCKSCKVFPRVLGSPEVLDAGDGIDILQVASNRVRLVQGGAHITALRITPQGVDRWYAACAATARSALPSPIPAGACLAWSAIRSPSRNASAR